MFNLLFHNKSKSFSSLSTSERTKSFVIYNKKKNFEKIYNNKKKVLSEIIRNLNKNLKESKLLKNNRNNNFLFSFEYSKIFPTNALKILKENNYYDKKFSINNNDGNKSINSYSYKKIFYNNENNININKKNNININNKNKSEFNNNEELLKDLSELKYFCPLKKIINKSKKNKKYNNFTINNENNSNILDYNIYSTNNSNELNDYKYNILKNFNNYLENKEKFYNYYDCNAKIKDDMIKQKTGIKYPGNFLLLKNNLEKYDTNFKVIHSNYIKKVFKKFILVPLNSHLPKPKVSNENNNNFSHFSIKKVYNNNNLFL